MCNLGPVPILHLKYVEDFLTEGFFAVPHHEKGVVLLVGIGAEACKEVRGVLAKGEFCNKN